MSTVSERHITQSIDSADVLFINIEAQDGEVKFISVKGTSNPNESPLLVPHDNSLRVLVDLKAQIDAILDEAEMLNIRIR